ncbi:MAG: hypothetical protein IT458_20815 [Planctomycetes bacterium]|nr:hypothetical protein [Planctomycetota bacterium]
MRARVQDLLVDLTAKVCARSGTKPAYRPKVVPHVVAELRAELHAVFWHETVPLARAGNVVDLGRLCARFIARHQWNTDQIAGVLGIRATTVAEWVERARQADQAVSSRTPHPLGDYNVEGSR